jgi:RNA polymerase sigma-70 factor (ECF subfamily)
MKKKTFEKFYSANMERIYRYVFFRVGQNHALTEDLVSEIFMKALKAFDRYDEKVSRSAWIYRIAHNHLANHYRDSKKVVDLEEVAYSLVDHGANKQQGRLEAVMGLEKALAELSTEERQLVTMKHIEGYTYVEIAEIQEKSPGSVKMAVSRAMKKLRSKASSL